MWQKLCEGVRDLFVRPDPIVSGLRCPNCDKVFSKPQYKKRAKEEEIVSEWVEDKRHTKDDCLFHFMKQERSDRREKLRLLSRPSMSVCNCKCSGGCNNRKPPVDILPAQVEGVETE